MLNTIVHNGYRPPAASTLRATGGSTMSVLGIIEKAYKTAKADPRSPQFVRVIVYTDIGSWQDCSVESEMLLPFVEALLKDEHIKAIAIGYNGGNGAAPLLDRSE